MCITYWPQLATPEQRAEHERAEIAFRIKISPVVTAAATTCATVSLKVPADQVAAFNALLHAEIAKAPS